MSDLNYWHKKRKLLLTIIVKNYEVENKELGVKEQLLMKVDSDQECIQLLLVLIGLHLRAIYDSEL